MSAEKKFNPNGDCKCVLFSQAHTAVNIKACNKVISEGFYDQNF